MRPDGTLFEADDGPWVDMTTVGVHHLAMLLIDACIREKLDSVRIHLRMAKKAGQRWGPRLDYEWSQKLMAEEKTRRAIEVYAEASVEQWPSGEDMAAECQMQCDIARSVETLTAREAAVIMQDAPAPKFVTVEEKRANHDI